ncbi:MAG: hypothetical protein LVQ95_02305 [Candidatus Micrarchaeales archaeon]|nr:hypothetical protein [Candidatus Micrarchaeales archaeon]
MRKQFWNEEKTNESMAVLNSLKRSVDFVLIGGWAVYMYTNAQKSEDVDIALDYSQLGFFKKYGVGEYERMRIKYSKIGNVVVDLFIPEFTDSDLPVPVSVILRDCVLVNGIKVVRKELLLLLKLWAYFGNDAIKLRKDEIDVATLLFYTDINLKAFKRYIDEYKITRRRSSDVLLEYLDKARTSYEFICESEREYDRLHSLYKKEIRELFEY